jgi:signal transduction histidine kinase
VTPTIADIGFIATLEEMTDHYRSVKAFEIQFESSINETLIDQDMQLTIYRILQEGLNNIVKYAKASLVTINIAQNCHGLRLEIKDDGIGFDLAKVSDGLGLKNIKNRAEVFKGRVL